mmetsp:Transcript_16038/g.29624  ORF Transcript_16038/g.29624 Transcript_16038/m.29624 type:complete len:127 (+) Transcript_16038:64-444(+)
MPSAWFGQPLATCGQSAAGASALDGQAWTSATNCAISSDNRGNVSVVSALANSRRSFSDRKISNPERRQRARLNLRQRNPAQQRHAQCMVRPAFGHVRPISCWCLCLGWAGLDISYKLCHQLRQPW